MSGEATDRVPVFPNLDFWYRARQLQGDWPPGLAGRSLDEIVLSLGMGLAKFTGVFRPRFRPPTGYGSFERGAASIEEWTTSQGTLRRVRTHEARQKALGMNPHPTEYPIKSEADYPAFIELMEHLEFDADPGFSRFRELDRRLGENGVPMVGLSKSPAHDLMMKWIGYENAYVHMVEHPELFGAAIEAANRAHRRCWPIVADSPCRIIMHCGNFSAMTPPPLFHRYLMPYLKAFNDTMHAAGKLVISHTDGDMSGLLELFRDTKFDGTNCHACAPLVPCKLEETARAWGNKVVVWGGMPSTLLESYASQADFEAQLRRLADAAAGGTRLIVGVSDHAMPEARYDRIAALASFFAGCQPGRG